MFRKTTALLLAAASVGCMLTSCGKTKLEGKYELCTSYGKGLDVDVRFRADGSMRFNGEKCSFEVLNANTLKIKNSDDSSVSGKVTFEIKDKDDKLIYIEDVSEKFEKTELNQAASTLMKAYTTAAVELDDEGQFDLDGAYIVADPDHTKFDVMNGKDEELADTFREYSKPFFENTDELSYFVVMNDGVCVAAAASFSDGEGEVTGLYPANKIVDIVSYDYSEEFGSKDKITYDEVYQKYKDQINKINDGELYFRF